MPESLYFKYNPTYIQVSALSDLPCDLCGISEGFPHFEASYLDIGESYESVCINCLISGKLNVRIPDHVRQELYISLRSTCIYFSEKQIEDRVSMFMDELSLTPPVPWIQNNNWPSHHGDFCQYIGEWNQELLKEESRDGDGLGFLMEIIKDSEVIHDPSRVWESIGDGWTTIYVFQCFFCQKYTGIDQSY